MGDHVFTNASSVAVGAGVLLVGWLLNLWCWWRSPSFVSYNTTGRGSAGRASPLPLTLDVAVSSHRGESGESKGGESGESGESKRWRV